MPINACSINTYSIDAICSAKKAKYIDMLWDNPLPVLGGGGLTGYYPEFRTDDEVKVNPLDVEHSVISLTVTLGNETVTTLFDNDTSQIHPLIAINKLSSSKSEVSVVIDKFEIGKL